MSGIGYEQTFPRLPGDVCFRGESGPFMSGLSISAFDPKRTLDERRV